jgi:serine protease Do
MLCVEETCKRFKLPSDSVNKLRIHRDKIMTQSTLPETSSAFPLPDAFSTALTALFTQSQASIVQIRTEGRGGGTGVIWQNDGRIITNNHVVASDDAQVQVSLVDGRSFKAQILQRNPQLDLALLKISGENLQALPFADSSTLRVGEWVFAIGHPWGQRWVMTAGIAGTQSTMQMRDGSKTQYIKSDVGLAPGNSGGPLLNADGAVVGINSMIFGGDLAVSIPSSVVNTWLAALPKGHITLGIELLQVELPVEIGKSLQPARNTGLLVTGTPARQEDLHDLFIGDILLAAAGKPLNNAGTLRQLLNQSQPDQPISLTILRGGTIVTVDIATQIQEQAA